MHSLVANQPTNVCVLLSINGGFTLIVSVVDYGEKVAN